MLELGYRLNEVHVNPEKNLIVTSAANGTVQSYNVDYIQDAENVPFYLFSPTTVRPSRKGPAKR